MKRLRAISALAMVGLMAGLALTACQQSEPISRVEDHRGRPIQLTVYTYPNYRAVTDTYIDRQIELGRNPTPDDYTSKVGWSEWHRVDDKQVCIVHVRDLNQADDDRMLTLGHEVAHCVFGGFHEPNTAVTP